MSQDLPNEAPLPLEELARRAEQRQGSLSLVDAARIVREDRDSRS